MKYTINEIANSKGVSQLVREALLQMEAELNATNRQVEILSDALAESRREVAAKDEAMKQALNKAFQLGQRYWSWSDSEYSSHWKKADAAKAEFDKLIEDTTLATPPAAQRQQVVFPTMLRKMWSGGEVQAWLDENVNKGNT
jgi:hypothetical protein